MHVCVRARTHTQVEDMLSGIDTAPPPVPARADKPSNLTSQIREGHVPLSVYKVGMWRVSCKTLKMFLRIRL